MFLRRHGARNPSRGMVASFLELERWLREEVRWGEEGGVDWAREWRCEYKMEEAGMLNEVGVEEIREVVRALKRAYPEFGWDSIVCNVLHTEVKRTEESARAFVRELPRGDLTCVFRKPFQRDDDALLRPFDACPRWKQVFGGWKVEEMVGREWDGLRSRLSGQFGASVNSELMKSMYMACVFELAMQGKDSRWCSLFTVEEMKMFERVQSIEDTVIRSCAVDSIGCEIAAPLFRDIVDRVDQIVFAHREGRAERLGTFRWTHAETMLPLLSFLNLTTELEGSSGVLDTSISCFSSNLLLVVYHCRVEANLGEPYRLATYLNGGLVQFPACGEDLCGIERFKRVHRSQLAVEFDKICRPLEG